MLKRAARCCPDAVMALPAVLVAGGLVVLLCLLFQPVWETNDDVGMAMIAHGFGIADHASATLIFSNVVWGWIVQNLPMIDGLLGYSLGTIGCLVLAGAAMTYALLRLGAGPAISVLVMILVMSRAVLFPQFTVNAGLLTVAAVVLIVVYDRTDSIGSLIAASIFGLLGFLVRNQEFALVLFVALPVLPWRLFRRRAAQIAVAIAAVLLIGLTAADYLAVSGPDWAYHWELNWPRAMFTDFRAGSFVLQRPDVMARYGLSANDLNLIGNWFFVDRQLADPALLKNLLNDVAFKAGIPFELSGAVPALHTLFAKAILPLTATVVVALILAMRSKIWLSALLCVVAIALLGAFGRSLPRVIIPLVVLLLVVTVTSSTLHQGWRRYAMMAGLALACLGNFSQLVPEARDAGAKVAVIKDSKFVLPNATIVWGSAFPYEHAFPVLTRWADTRDTRILALGGSTFAPFSVGYAEETGGRGTIKRLTGLDGIPLIASDPTLDMLRIYCRERHQSTLTTTEMSRTNAWTILNATYAKPG